MTREEYLVLRNTNPIDLLYNYCLHKGKTEEESQKIKYIVQNPVILLDWYNYAIQELDIEFEISILSKDGNPILIF